MSSTLANRIAFIAASAGTGPFVFGSGVTSFLTLAQGVASGEIGNGDLVSYIAQDSTSSPTQAEWGQGTFSSAGSGLIVRTTVYGTNNNGTTGSGSPLAFSVPPTILLTILSQDVRQILSANTNYYVTTTGSDSNPGSSTSPWATLTHAMTFISNLDIAGLFVQVNIGSGTFVGFGSRACVGGGFVGFIGAGPTNTTITAGPNDGVYNFGECWAIAVILGTQLFVDQVTFSNGISGANLIGSYVNNVYGIGSLITSTGGACNFVSTINDSSQFIVFVQGSGNDFAVAGGNYTIVGGSWSTAWGVAFGAVVDDSGTWTLTGTPSFSNGFVQFTNGARFTTHGSSSYTGAATGSRFFVSTDSAYFGTSGTPGHQGVNFFPGNSVPAGSLDATSSYDGIPGSNYNYQQPVTGFTITMNNGDTDLIIDPAGTLAAGTVKMAAAPVDSQKITIRTSQIITSLTINGNGATVAGYATGTLPLGGVLNAIYRSPNTTWYF